MLNIPEITVFQALNALLEYIRSDFKNNPNEEKTFLYKNLKGEQIEGIDLYQESKKLFLPTNKSQRAFKISMGYDLNRANLPTMHIIVPSDIDGGINGLGGDEGYIRSNDESRETKETIYSRGFGAQYNLLITSDNQYELLIIYHLFRALLVATTPQLDNDGKFGLRNLKLSGQDITLQQDLVPVHIFHRILAINFVYEVDVIITEQIDLRYFSKINSQIV